ADVARLIETHTGFLDRHLADSSDHPALLNPSEREALIRRAKAIIRHPRFPILRSGRAFPWPLI
ncbi:MAG: hypothetical protein ACRDRT_13100, partial [Pseudonocardiaceae bacterium]